MKKALFYSKKQFAVLTDAEAEKVSSFLVKDKKPAHFDFNGWALKTSLCEVLPLDQAVTDEQSDEMERRQAHIKKIDKERKDIANSPVERKIKLMWRNKVVWEWLMHHGFTRVLGEGWQKKDPVDIAREAYTLIKEPIKSEINVAIEEYFNEHKGAHMAPREVYQIIVERSTCTPKGPDKRIKAII